MTEGKNSECITKLGKSIASPWTTWWKKSECITKSQWKSESTQRTKIRLHNQIRQVNSKSIAHKYASAYDICKHCLTIPLYMGLKHWFLNKEGLLVWYAHSMTLFASQRQRSQGDIQWGYLGWQGQVHFTCKTPSKASCGNEAAHNSNMSFSFPILVLLPLMQTRKLQTTQK